MEFIYIKYNVPQHYVVFDQEMDAENFPDLGSTYEDYLSNKWVQLNEEQAEFHKQNPNASVKEVWTLTLQPPYTPTLDEVKNEKIAELNVYDQTNEVNSFTVNNVVSAWFTPTERSNYKSSIEAAKLLGQPSLALFIGDTMVEIKDISMAETMLAQIQLYADYCFLVTKQHKINIMKLETIEEVKAYDYTVNYPEKLNFDLF